MNRSCKALWDGLLEFCVVASRNHVYMGDSVSIGTSGDFLRTKSMKYCGGYSSKINKRMVIGIAFWHLLRSYLTRKKGICLEILETIIGIGDRFVICFRQSFGFG